MRKIKNIIFDFGGVVVDLDRSNAVRLFKEIGVEDADERLDVYHQNGIFLQAETGEVTAGEFIDKLSDLVGKPVSYEQAYKCWNGFIVNVNQYKLDYMLELRKRGYKVYILSNTNPFIMEWARSDNFSEAGHPIDYYFDKVYTSYELKCVKPNREIFDIVIADAGIIPQESVFVDDGQNNINTGNKLGFVTLMPENCEDWRDKLEKLL